jgi:acetate kinase
VREKVAQMSAWLGVSIDPAANAAHALRIDAPDSRVAVAVLPTNEEGMIARYTAELLNG